MGFGLQVASHFQICSLANKLRLFVRLFQSMLTLKHRFYTFCSDQVLLYNYKADLHGIGNRSIFVVWPISSTNISQGSVATNSRGGSIFYYRFTTNVLQVCR